MRRALQPQVAPRYRTSLIPSRYLRSLGVAPALAVYPSPPSFNLNQQLCSLVRKRPAETSAWRSDEQTWRLEGIDIVLHVSLRRSTQRYHSVYHSLRYACLSRYIRLMKLYSEHCIFAMYRHLASFYPYLSPRCYFVPEFAGRLAISPSPPRILVYAVQPSKTSSLGSDPHIVDLTHQLAPSPQS